MQTDQIFNKPVLLNNTYDYVGTLYKLIASVDSGEILYALVEGDPYGKMFVLPLDKITNITDDYLVIDSRQVLSDFESFQEMAEGKYLILDENTVNRSDVKQMIERRVAFKTGMTGPVSYLSFMQCENPENKQPMPETYMTASAAAKAAAVEPQQTLVFPEVQKTPVFQETQRTSAFPETQQSPIFPETQQSLIFPETQQSPIFQETRQMSVLPKSGKPNDETGIYQTDKESFLKDKELRLKSEEQRIQDEEARLSEREARLRSQEELLRNEEIRLAREHNRLKNESSRLREEELSRSQILRQREEKLLVSEEVVVEREKSFSIELNSKSEDLRQLELNINKEREVLQRLIVQREAVSSELEQIKAEIETNERLKAENLTRITGGETEVRELMARKESLNGEIMAAKAELDRVIRETHEQKRIHTSQVETSQEDNDMARLFMLQEERLKRVSQLHIESPPQNLDFTNAENETWRAEPETGFTSSSGDAWELKPVADNKQDTHDSPVNSLSIDFLSGNNLGIVKADDIRQVESAGISPVEYTEPVHLEEPRGEKTDLVQNYIEKQRGVLLGKTLRRSITDEHGNILLDAGTVITENIFDAVSAKRKDAVIELAMFAE